MLQNTYKNFVFVLLLDAEKSLQCVCRFGFSGAKIYINNYISKSQEILVCGLYQIKAVCVTKSKVDF